MPVDRAKFLAGSKFDLRVELAVVRSVKVTVNGQDAAQALGVTPCLPTWVSAAEPSTRCVTSASPSLVRLRWSQAVTVAGPTSRRSPGRWLRAQAPATPAKNVILFVGDGMSLPMRTAARVLSKGVTEGKYNGMLEMDSMDASGMITTSGLDAIATDSANAMSAYTTRHKSAVNAMGVYPDNTPDPTDDPKVETLAELLKRVRGMAVGIVTTSEMQDATPAAVFSHTRRRSEYVNIMDQALKDPQAADVLMGGGSASLLPQSTPARLARTIAT